MKADDPWDSVVTKRELDDFRKELREEVAEVVRQVHDLWLEAEDSSKETALKAVGDGFELLWQGLER